MLDAVPPPHVVQLHRGGPAATPPRLDWALLRLALDLHTPTPLVAPQTRAQNRVHGLAMVSAAEPDHPHSCAPRSGHPQPAHKALVDHA